jgi:hypothetical protein
MNASEKATRFEQEKQSSSVSDKKSPQEMLMEKVDIQLFRGDYPNEPAAVFAVQLRSKMKGNNKPMIYLESQLLTCSKEMRIELRKFHGLDSVYDYLLHVISEMKDRQDYTVVPNLYALMYPCAEYKKGVELYGTICRNIQSQLHRFPLLSEKKYQKGDPGLILDTRTFAGQNAVAIPSETLYALLGWEKSKSTEQNLLEVCESWVELGYLIKKSEGHYTYPFLGKTRFYIFKLPDGEVVE